MKRGQVILPIALILLIGLPLLGVWLSGKPLSRYLEFPPRSTYIQHDPFSWSVFVALALLILLVTIPVVYRIVRFALRRSRMPFQEGRPTLGVFPWWGWAAMAWTMIWWVLAWTRFPWMSWLQEHTFTPLWLGYIVVVNGWTFARSGHCMMLHRPRYFLSLFPLSAGFWWFFEYLNRFVQNWHYLGAAELSPLEYFVRATIPFSTVLPAVIGTAELLTTFPILCAGLEQWKQVRVEQAKLVGWSVLGLSCVGLFALGLLPNYLFPLVWLGPLLLIVSLETLTDQPTIVAPLARGDWRLIWVPALAALVCGLFWELWNWRSLAHWEYALPFVHRLQVFEMPLLGYAGYLPFGLECLVVADFCLSRQFSGGAGCYSRQRGVLNGSNS